MSRFPKKVGRYVIFFFGRVEDTPTCRFYFVNNIGKITDTILFLEGYLIELA